MSTLVHDHDTSYVLTPYRERLTVSSLGELRSRVKALSLQFGERVLLTALGNNLYDVACSNRSGYLLAETVCACSPDEKTFVYAEKHEEIYLVVVVDEGQVLMDVTCSQEECLQHVLSYSQSISGCGCMMYGFKWDVKQALMMSDQGVMPQYKTHSLWRSQKHESCHLHPLSFWLKKEYQPWYRRYRFALAAVCVIGCLAVAVYRVNHPPVSVFVAAHQQSIGERFKQADLASDVLTHVSQAVMTVQSWPGVAVHALTWNESRFQLKASLPSSLRHHAWEQWLKARHFEVRARGDASELSQEAWHWAHAPLDVKRSAQQLSDQLADRMEASLGKLRWLETSQEKRGSYTLMQTECQVKGVTAARLSLLADSLRAYPVTLNHLALHDRKGLFWGSLSLTVWGAYNGL